MMIQNTYSFLIGRSNNDEFQEVKQNRKIIREGQGVIQGWLKDEDFK